MHSHENRAFTGWELKNYKGNTFNIRSYFYICELDEGWSGGRAALFSLDKRCHNWVRRRTAQYCLANTMSARRSEKSIKAKPFSFSGHVFYIFRSLSQRPFRLQWTFNPESTQQRKRGVESFADKNEANVE